MKHVIFLVYFTIAVNASAHSLEFSLSNIVSYIEENFKIDQLYSRSQLIMENGSSNNPQLLWKLMGLNKYTKGYRSQKQDVKPKVYFYSLNAGSHKFKCYVDRNSIKHCVINFTKLVIGNRNRVIEKINDLKTTLSHSEFCVAKDGKNKSKLFINTLCKSEKGSLEIAVTYKPGQSKRALIKLKLIPKG